VERLAKKQAMDDFLYGSVQLRAKGHQVDLFELPETSRHPIVRRIFNWMGKRDLLPHKVDGALIEQTLEVSPMLELYDVVVVAGSPVVFALAMCRWLGVRLPPLVGIHCGLLNYDFRTFQRFLTRHFLKRMWTVLFGEGEYQPLCDFLGHGKERIFVNECGTDIHFWTPGENLEQGYILSIGNDGRRDYDLLVRAAAEIKSSFKIITSREIREKIPSNVEIIRGDMRKEILSDEELRDIYRAALCVVVPLTETFQPSGQSVALQAMACGKTVVLSRINGIWSESKMRDKENIVFVKPGDKDDLVQKLNYVLEHPEKRREIGAKGLEITRKEWSMESYAERIEKVCRTAIAG